MIKQLISILMLLIVSALVVVGMSFAQQIVMALVSAHDWFADILKNVFSAGPIGDVLRQLLASLIMPLLIGLLPALIFWIIKRSWFPYFMTVVWSVWLLQTGALVVLVQHTQ